jgi:hypothetical protein
VPGDAKGSAVGACLVARGRREPARADGRLGVDCVDVHSQIWNDGTVNEKVVRPTIDGRGGGGLLSDAERAHVRACTSGSIAVWIGCGGARSAYLRAIRNDDHDDTLRTRARSGRTLLEREPFGCESRFRESRSRSSRLVSILVRRSPPSLWRRGRQKQQSHTARRAGDRSAHLRFTLVVSRRGGARLSLSVSRLGHTHATRQSQKAEARETEAEVGCGTCVSRVSDGPRLR